MNRKANFAYILTVLTCSSLYPNRSISCIVSGNAYTELRVFLFGSVAARSIVPVILEIGTAGALASGSIAMNGPDIRHGVLQFEDGGKNSHRAGNDTIHTRVSLGAVAMKDRAMPNTPL